MTSKIGEIQKDIAELESLQKNAGRKRVLDILSLEVKKLQTELTKLQEERKTIEASGEAAGTATDAGRALGNKKYEVKLNGYGWDQSDKYVKVFVTLKDVHLLPKEKVFCKLTEKSMELRVTDLDNKDFSLLINRLLEPIEVEASHWKQKTDMVVIFLAKARQNYTWSHMTDLEKKCQENRSNRFKTDGLDKSKDPQDSLMSLMRNMYETGDDDTKRMIAKAWTEGQDKHSSTMDL